MHALLMGTGKMEKGRLEWLFFENVSAGFGWCTCHSSLAAALTLGLIFHCMAFYL